MSSSDVVDNSQIAELNRWLDELLAQKPGADPLTLCNVHRRLAKLHTVAAEAALARVNELAASDATTNSR